MISTRLTEIRQRRAAGFLIGEDYDWLFTEVVRLQADLLAAQCDADDLRSRLALAEDLIEDTTGMNGGAPMEPVKSAPAPLPTGPAHEDDE